MFHFDVKETMHEKLNHHLDWHSMFLFSLLSLKNAHNDFTDLLRWLSEQELMQLTTEAQAELRRRQQGHAEVQDIASTQNKQLTCFIYYMLIIIIQILFFLKFLEL